ncbi:MAG: RluA family pseudouridine synthase [Saprospiraceae bacterium]
MDKDLVPENEQHDELFETLDIVVDPKQKTLRIDKFLMMKIERTTRNRIQNLIKSGNVTVNQKAIKANYKIRPKDKIHIILPFVAKDNDKVLPEDIPLNIVYEDADVLVVNKPANLVVHPGIGNPNGTLVNALMHHLQASELPVMAGNTPDRPGLVHRIDKDTTGLMVIGKTEYALNHLAKQFYNHTTERRYYALVWGEFEEPNGTLTGNIKRDIRDRRKMRVCDEEEGGKHAITHYKTIENLYYVSLVECKLETGRTHQIRVHMKHHGHPLFGDPRYDGTRIHKGTVFTKYKMFVENNLRVLTRQALHAKTLGFEHPTTGERMQFNSELPEDFATVLDRWRKYLDSRKDKM